MAINVQPPREGMPSTYLTLSDSSLSSPESEQANPIERALSLAEVMVRAQAELSQMPPDTLRAAAARGMAEHHTALDQGSADSVEVEALGARKELLQSMLPAEDRAEVFFMAHDALLGTEMQLETPQTLL